MKTFILVLLSTLFPSFAVSQDADSLLALLDSSQDATPLLPEQMSVAKRWLWSEKGLMRKTGIFPLTTEDRQRELRLRRKMLKTHQVAGYATSALMLGTAIAGQKAYDGEWSGNIHKSIELVMATSYAVTGALSLLSPPPLLVEGKKLSNIKVHRILAYVHGTGMITNGLFGETMLQTGRRDLHRMVGYTTAGALWGAMIVMKF